MKYETIQLLKKNKILNIDEINYMNVCAEMLYNMSFIRFFRLFVYSIFYTNKLMITGVQGEILIAYSLASKKRQDYDEIVHNLSACIDSDEVNCRIELKFNILMPFRLFIAIMKMPVFKLIKMQGIKDGMLLAFLAANYYTHNQYIRDTLDKIQCRVLYTFCDALPIENLISQIAGTLNIKTITLQHGQYAYNDLTDNGSSNDEGYLNFVSDYICVWGKATYDEFIKAGIDSKRLLITGSLRAYALNNNKKIIYENKLETKKFGLILSADSYMDDNIEMIILANKIADKYDYSYVVRCHPNNNMQVYNGCFNGNDVEIVNKIDSFEYFDAVDFSLMFQTGVFNEAVAYRAKIFIYMNERLLSLYRSLDITISSLEDFDAKYKAIISDDKSLDVYNDLYDYFNVSGDICANYKSSLNRLCVQ